MLEARSFFALTLALAISTSPAFAMNLARILWHLLRFKEPFNPEVFKKEAEKMRRQKLARLRNLAAALNYQLLPQS